MSMIQCDDCEKIFDSDEDPDCFVTWPDYFPADRRGAVTDCVVCEPCRERQWEQQQKLQEP